MAIDLEAARRHAAEHPECIAHAALLRKLDPGWMPGTPVTASARPPLDLRAARAALAARRQEQQRPAPPTPPARPPAPDRILDLSAVRRAQQTAHADRTMPDAPITAVHFVGHDGTRKWVSIESGAPGARRWERLLTSLIASGPFAGLRVRAHPVDGSGTGQTLFHRCPETGAEWVNIDLDPSPGTVDVDRLIAHEAGHVAEEGLRLSRSVTASAWRAGFARPSEAFATGAEDWLRPGISLDVILDRARQAQAGRRA